MNGVQTQNVSGHRHWLHVCFGIGEHLILFWLLLQV